MCNNGRKVKCETDVIQFIADWLFKFYYLKNLPNNSKGKFCEFEECFLHTDNELKWSHSQCKICDNDNNFMRRK